MTLPQDTHLLSERPTEPKAGSAKKARTSGSDRLRQLVEVDETPVGRGVFARRKLKAGMVLGEIHGEIFPVEPEDPSYCMELPSGRVLEPTAPLRFLNHSCDPNCELFYWFDEDGSLQEDRLWLQTIRSINAGDELLIDYCWPADAAIPCRCGVPGCRGWIVDPEELHLLMSRQAAGTTDPDAGDSVPPSQSESSRS
jgi:hypothetical protein